jgi:hypothetical protein
VDYVIRFIAGGAVVSIFSVLGDLLRPKSFAGLFGAAALDATGAGWGSLAMALFAVVVWIFAPNGAPLSLGLASIVWVYVAVGLFFLRRKCRRG